MIKYLISFLLFASTCLAGMGIGGFPFPGPGSVTDVTSFGCNTTPFITQDAHANGTSVGSSANDYYVGIVNTNSSGLYICSISLYSRGNGTLTDKTFSVEKWSYSTSTGALITKQSTVASIPATAFPTTIGYYNIVTDTTLAQNEALVFTLNTIDAANNVTLAFDSNDTVTGQHYRAWSNALASTGGGEIYELRAIFYGAL